MVTALTWLTGSRLGRWAAVGVLVLVLIGALVASIRAHGRSDAAAKAAQERVKRVTEVLDAVKRMGDAQAAGPRDRRDVLERLRRGDA